MFQCASSPLRTTTHKNRQPTNVTGFLEEHAQGHVRRLHLCRNLALHACTLSMHDAFIQCGRSLPNCCCCDCAAPHGRRADVDAVELEE